MQLPIPKELKGVSKLNVEEIFYKIISCSIEVHKELGPGLLEQINEQCLKVELRNNHLSFEFQTPKEIIYKGESTGKFYKLDLLVEDLVVIELKRVSEINPIHVAQLINYLNIFRKPKGLLMNFNTTHLMSSTNTYVSKYYKLLE